MRTTGKGFMYDENMRRIKKPMPSDRRHRE